MFAKFDENGNIVSCSDAASLQDVRPDPKGFEEIPEFSEEDRMFLKKENGTVTVNETLKKQSAENRGKLEKYLRNKAELVKLTEDMVQYVAGEDVPDIEDRKSEFIRIHNEVRAYEGKEARNIL